MNLKVSAPLQSPAVDTGIVMFTGWERLEIASSSPISVARLRDTAADASVIPLKFGGFCISPNSTCTVLESANLGSRCTSAGNWYEGCCGVDSVDIFPRQGSTFDIFLTTTRKLDEFEAESSSLSCCPMTREDESSNETFERMDLRAISMLVR